ncbi:hypothetical protein EV138_5819 [Kribbella voronezhensis]|uniref:Phytanoyl-CoA dioxygenase PhyH n=1 Tax=Kribbella voronezhensis TaxID=2512212 RepID=A0A4R7SWN3_9ACTN|nr:hypothetical protein [Kribbella voronezhensis]TDU83355.1 hypothetical protein EV138_5819 [Kribbella voronezhensis]
MPGVRKVDAAGFWDNGWTIVRGVYTAEDVKRLRDAAYWSRKHFGGDLLANPRLREVLTDGNFVQIARRILGDDKIVYCGDSAFTVNGVQRGFHKDNADRVDPQAPDWNGRYTILRFGVYLQDHYRHTGGLNLRHQSHNTPDLSVGKNVYVRTRPGDVAVWSLRTTHSGNATLLRFPKSYAPLPHQHDKFPSWLVAPRDGDRIALFAALGLDDAHMSRYVDYLKTRKYMCDIWRRSRYDESAVSAAEQAGLIVRNVPAEIENDANAGRNVDYVALPY